MTATAPQPPPFRVGVRLEGPLRPHLTAGSPPPIEGAVEALKVMAEHGLAVHVFSGGDISLARAWVRAHLAGIDASVAADDRGADIIIDDRAVPFTSWPQTLMGVMAIAGQAEPDEHAGIPIHHPTSLGAGAFTLEVDGDPADPDGEPTLIEAFLLRATMGDASSIDLVLPDSLAIALRDLLIERHPVAPAVLYDGEADGQADGTLPLEPAAAP